MVQIVGHTFKGKDWRVIKEHVESSKSAVLLEGEKLNEFYAEQSVDHGCNLSPILF